MFNILDKLDQYELQTSLLSEAERKKADDHLDKTDHLQMEIADVEKFVKRNELRPITNPIFFVRDNIPSPDGLLSNEIFGISKTDRAGIWAYIDLERWFMDPSCFKVWCSIDSNLKACVHGTKRYIIDDKGYLTPIDTGGSTGIEFIKKNINNIKFKHTDSRLRDIKIKYLEKNKDRMFIKKFLICPAYYRDVNTTGKNTGVGKLNQMFASIISMVRSLRETEDYGLPRSDMTCGKLQETLVQVYDWCCGNTNPSISPDEAGTGLSGKYGILKRAGESKTTDYSSRLVLSAPELKVERSSDLMVTMRRSAVPLACVCADFYPYIIFHVRRFFENEFMGVTEYPVLNKEHKIVRKKPKDPLIEFSDERIKAELKRFIHGYTNRLIPIRIPMEDGSSCFMRFVGRFTPVEDIEKENLPESIQNRRLTWCDIFYMAAVAATKDKSILITRYPMDRIWNQIPTNIIVSSTVETEPMQVKSEFYKYYPKIREEDIGKNTGTMFVDTLRMSNLLLDGFGGDYDGDQVTVKGAYYVETNQELQAFIDSKMNYISAGGTNFRIVHNDCLQSIYSLTLALEGTKLEDPVF